MAVLCAVGDKNDGVIVSYSSDPILTFGASRLWYANNRENFKDILVYFRDILCQEVTRAAPIGEMVSQILLLLAMDLCPGIEGSSNTRENDGTFYPVQTFMYALGHDKGVDCVPSFLQEYSVGFSHFVQLAYEPDEHVLWFLLYRRAAGMMPGGQEGGDLIIPIFHRKKISFILIQCKNRQSRVSGYEYDATVRLRPEYVFSNSSDLKKYSPNQIIRIFMQVADTERSGEREIIKDDKQMSTRQNKGKEDFQAFCIFGIESWRIPLNSGNVDIFSNVTI